MRSVIVVNFVLSDCRGRTRLIPCDKIISHI
jgi:hypothetical protein